MAWTMRDAKRDRAVIENIESGEDRAAAILAASYLEDRITSAIKARMVKDAEVHGKFFKGYGPLSSFAAKIDLSYLIGIIPRESRDAFHVIREVRNRFAHRLDINSFDDQPISDICSKTLYRPGTIKWMRDQIVKGAEEQGVEGGLNGVLFLFEPLMALPDTARNAYMSTIKVLLMIMEIDTAFALKAAGEELDLILRQPLPSQKKSA